MVEGDITSLNSAKAAGIYAAFETALKSKPEAVLQEIDASQLRGRGGAGFPAGRKLRTVAGAPDKGGKRYVVVNADAGDAGAYIDKALYKRMRCCLRSSLSEYFVPRHSTPPRHKVLTVALATIQPIKRVPRGTKKGAIPRQPIWRAET